MRALVADKEVAFLLGCSASTRHARTDRPELAAPPFVKIGGRIYYQREVAFRWARERGIPIRGVEQRPGLTARFEPWNALELFPGDVSG
jgi:hypothetical protein